MKLMENAVAELKTTVLLALVGDMPNCLRAGDPTLAVWSAIAELGPYILGYSWKIRAYRALFNAVQR